jgi:uncharacterized protein (UPF0276 family)
MKPLLGISLMHENDFLQAALPLFVNGEVDCVEWSFDTIRTEKEKPEWLHELLLEYSKNNRLIGHGVRYSLLNALTGKRQKTWLKELKTEVKKYNYVHITEHFGFMSSDNFHQGAPLPVPLNKTTLAIGIDRLKAIQEITKLPLGIENLAFSFSEKDVREQGKFLSELIRPLNGFIILDLHNIYCQAKNFRIDLMKLVKMYPLEKVREIHLSGGSWQNSVYTTSLKKVRRDTHDEKIPAEILKILPSVFKICPNLKFIIFERLGTTLPTEKEKNEFRADFKKIKNVVNGIKWKNNEPEHFLPKKIFRAKNIQHSELHEQQQFILKTLRKNKFPSEALRKLNVPLLKEWNIKNWDPSLVETAIQLIQKWG